MIKTFCDQCRQQITDERKMSGGANGGRLAASVGHLGVEVIVSQNNVSNAGDYCKYCVLDALYQLDDRPREEKP